MVSQARQDSILKLKFGSFEFDPRRHELRRNGFRIKLAASQLRLLTLFLERNGELVTREQIAARLWVDTRNIDVSTGINTAINRLRRHLQEAPGAPSAIETVIGLGYRFVPELNFESTAEEAARIETDAEPSQTMVEERNDSPPDIEREDNDPEDIGQLVDFQAFSTELDEPVVTDSEFRQPELAVYSPAPTTVVKPEHPFVRPLRAGMLALGGLGLLGVLAFFIVHRRFAENSYGPTLALSSAGSASMKPVTAEEEEGNLTVSAVSPSGESIAFADRFGVSVRWFPAATERLLGVRPSFVVHSLTWLPDESGLLMSGTDQVLRRQQVWFVPVQGAYLSLLVDNADHAAVSPDGSFIAVTRNQDRELWLGSANGQGMRRLRDADPASAFRTILWTPASNRLMTVEGRETSKTEDAGPVDASSQGVYECIDPKSGQVLDREEGFNGEPGYVLSDGSFFFVENGTPGPLSGTAELMKVQTDLGTGRFLNTPSRVQHLEAHHGGSLSASSNGARFALVLDRAETDTFVAGLSWPGPELKDVVRVTRGARQNFPHSWTADGKNILLENDSLTPNGAPAKWSIFKQPLDGSPASLVANLPASAALAELSPDGNWLLFLELSGRPQRVLGIFRVPVAGGPVEQVPTRGSIEEFHCSGSSSGRCVVRQIVGNERLNYYALDPIRGMETLLASAPWQPNRLGDWNISADGSTVVSARHDTLHPGVSLIQLGSTPTNIRDISIQGHGTTLGATWAPDGQTLFVECRTESGFELVSLDLAGNVKPLRESSSLIWAVPSRDGKKIAFPSLHFSRDVWMSTAGS